MYRLLVIGSVLMWVTAMSALFMRDVWPAWTAQDAPPITPALINQLNREQRQEQYGIFNNHGERLGTAWSTVSGGVTTTLDGTATLSFPPLPDLRIDTFTVFAQDGGLDEFDLKVYGMPATTIHVHGEQRGISFPCTLQVGPIERQANLELSASRMIGDALRPFSFLPTLKVGQSWRMQLLDPMSAAFSRRAEFTSIVARVTGEQTIDFEGKPHLCKIVETSPQHVRAWVAEDGHVLMQEVDLPVLGRLSVRQEHYNQGALTAAKNRIPAQGFHVGERE